MEPTDDLAERINGQIRVGTWDMEIQGAKHARVKIDDPDYPEVLQQLTSTKCIDFIFEEASELGPTTAEYVGSTLGGYLDIDPSRERRHEFGIAKDTSRSFPLNPSRSRESLCWHMVAEHRKRELLWLQWIEHQQFKRGLLICGIAHMLSISYRLLDLGYELEAVLYEPRFKIADGLRQLGFG